MRILSILMVCGLLSACAIDPIQRQPQVQVEAVTHKIAIQLDSEKLTEGDKSALTDFIYQRGEQSALRIKIDSYSDKGTKAVPELTTLLQQLGVYPSQVSSQFTAINASADIVLIVESYRSLVPHCQAGKEQHAVLNEFNTGPNFGCANASALAQMIATPRDLIVGRRLDATDGRKAVARVENYYQPASNKSQSDSNGDKSIAAILGGQ